MIFVPTETKGAKSKTMDTISPEIQLKRVSEKNPKNKTDRLRQMMAENKARSETKKAAESGNASSGQTQLTEKEKSTKSKSVETPKSDKKKANAKGKKKIKPETSPPSAESQTESN